MMPATPAARFDPEACYSITGGLSGVGRFLIRWMSDHGAQHFMVLSRRGTGSPRAQTFVKTLATHGVTVQPVACDGLAAKVLGAINLHAATYSLPLDFFVMTTSVEPVFAPATQSAYTAGKNFQDDFARYRRRLGLLVSTASFGLASDVGHLSTDSTAVDLFARNKVDDDRTSWISQQQAPMSAVNFVTCMDPAAMAARKREEAEADDADTMQNAADQGGKSAATRLRREFNEAIKTGPGERAKTLALVTGGIITAVAEVLFIEESGVNPGKAVADHGVNSLIAAELRNWFHVALGFNMTILYLLDAHTSINALAAKIVDAAAASSS
ncbi:hypothetical protein DL771_002724 [Monosporascus sp. 5C6A]|nr:hypothetical protein DL771_002724 [Monosporascus sp. 5C6A]